MRIQAKEKLFDIYRAPSPKKNSSIVYFKCLKRGPVFFLIDIN